MKDPCEACRRRESCRLPLNCEKYLAYRRAPDRLAEDLREARLAQLGGEAQAELLDKRTLERLKAMAEALPWRKEGAQHGEKE